MQLTKNFSDKEFACPCCGKCNMNKAFLEQLQRARDLSGVSFVVTSGYRCEKHNRKVGGKPNSSHLTGKAVDIRASLSSTRFIILSSLVMAGFNRIGVAKSFIHADSDSTKPPGTVWLYEDE